MLRQPLEGHVCIKRGLPSWFKKPKNKRRSFLDGENSLKAGLIPARDPTMNPNN